MTVCNVLAQVLFDPLGNNNKNKKARILGEIKAI